MRGRFITFEGVEGAGKSTQIAMLSQFLHSRGVVVHATREPGGSPLAERIRELFLAGDAEGVCAETELYLILAARAQHVGEVIRPALIRGTWVLCDRFQDSTLAYQGYGRGLDSEMIVRLGALARGGLVPDLTILLDVDPETGLTRCHHRLTLLTRLDQENLAFHRRVREGFLHLARQEPERIHLVDASQSPEVIFQQIQARLGDVHSRI
ncbi:MAG: dTMP kinase [Magnetococcales bacterium]|nr:dTMP kinase [Magnetococcales bacterium]